MSLQFVLLQKTTANFRTFDVTTVTLARVVLSECTFKYSSHYSKQV